MRIAKSSTGGVNVGRKFTLAIIFGACLFLASTVVAQTDCHTHGNERWCIGPDGKESQYPVSATASMTGTATQTGTAVQTDVHDDHDDHDDHEEEATTKKENCHFHAGVEHCGDDNDEEFDAATDCVVTDRDYKRGLRTGALFIVLTTSSIAVFSPIVLARFTKLKLTGIIFTIIKQFGTGVIIATSLIHLMTHATLMFENKCMGPLAYESTATALAMAGAFLSFIVEYIGDRFVQTRANKKKSDNAIIGLSSKEAPGDASSAEEPEEGQANGIPHVHGENDSHGHGHHHGAVGKDDKVGVIVMEAGIIFHSILIGLTTVVAGDSVFASLLVVVIFHQMFEGLALGTRISMLPPSVCSLKAKLIMGAFFALITPIGMAIGLGILNQFNGNDKSTLIAMGTLDAVSAGILLWVGFVEMWAADWIYGDMKTSGLLKTTVGMISLMAGMVLMGLLGKWA